MLIVVQPHSQRLNCPGAAGPPMGTAVSSCIHIYPVHVTVCISSFFTFSEATPSLISCPNPTPFVKSYLIFLEGCFCSPLSDLKHSHLPPMEHAFPCSTELFCFGKSSHVLDPSMVYSVEIIWIGPLWPCIPEKRVSQPHRLYLPNEVALHWPPVKQIR